MKMAQAYRTTYSTNFRWTDLKERTKSLAPRDKFAEKMPAGDDWIDLKDEEDEEDREGYEAIASFYNKRNTSTYRKDYCRKRKAEKMKGAEIDEDRTDNALLEYGADLYSPKSIKVLPPLPTARRIYGFLSRKRMATPLTTYQTHIGKLGYSLLMDNKKTAKNIKEIDESNKENMENVPIKKDINYKVTVNGRELTIKRTYDVKSGKSMCLCK